MTALRDPVSDALTRTRLTRDHRRRRWRRLAALVGVVALPVLALADEQIQGLGTGYWSYSQSITTATACIVRSVGSTECALFHAGDSWDSGNRVAVVSADGAGYCCFAGAPALAIDANLQITDSGGENGTGQGNCWRFGPTGGEWQVRPDRTTMRAAGASGTRPGLCSTALSGKSGSNEPATLTVPSGGAGGVYAPCAVNADCSSGWVGSGTCANPPSTLQTDRAGMLLNCVSASGTINVFVRKEYVKR